MTRHMRTCVRVLGLLAALAAGACEAPRQPARADLALVTQALDSQLDQPALQLQRTLRSADADHRIYSAELVLGGASTAIEVDWWLSQKGYIRFSGFDGYDTGYFVLTPKGEAFVHGPAPHWIATAFQGRPQVVCGDAGLEICRVTGVVTAALSPDGAALFDKVSIPPQPFTAELQGRPSAWTVQDAQLTGPGDIGGTVQTALFGDRSAVDKARVSWGLEMNRHPH